MYLSESPLPPHGSIGPVPIFSSHFSFSVPALNPEITRPDDPRASKRIVIAQRVVHFRCVVSTMHHIHHEDIIWVMTRPSGRHYLLLGGCLAVTGAAQGAQACRNQGVGGRSSPKNFGISVNLSWVINGWWHQFGSVVYDRLFWFSLNQRSAAQ